MTAPLPEGSLFAHRYRVVRLIAQGGMGAVYEVVHTETNRRRALKIMHPHLFENDDMRERFKREARVAAEIESEHLIDVSDAGIEETSQTPFMVMELLRGEELGKRVKRLQRLPPSEVLTYLRQTAVALDKTHAAAIVHRDLKPDNLFLTHRDDGSPRVKILDFGIAKVVNQGATGQGTQSIGTPLYMAPEQFHPGAKITPAADIFALGLVAFTLLVGVPYWRLESSSGIVAFIAVAISGPKTSPVERAADWGVTLPEAFDAWFFKATAFAPEKRFGSAGEAIAALDQIFAGMADADLMVTTPMPRPPAPSVPALGATPGTFVPTELPRENLAGAPQPSPAPENRILVTPKRNHAVFGAVAAVATATFVIGLWWALRTPEAAIAEPTRDAAAAPTQSINTPLPASEPTVLPATNLATSPSAGSSARVDEEKPVTLDKPVLDKPIAKPNVTPNAAPPPPAPAPAPQPAPAPTPTGPTKKTPPSSLLGQD